MIIAAIIRWARARRAARLAARKNSISTESTSPSRPSTSTTSSSATRVASPDPDSFPPLEKAASLEQPTIMDVKKAIPHPRPRKVRFQKGRPVPKRGRRAHPTHSRQRPRSIVIINPPPIPGLADSPVSSPDLTPSHSPTRQQHDGEPKRRQPKRRNTLERLKQQMRLDSEFARAAKNQFGAFFGTVPVVVVLAYPSRSTDYSAPVKDSKGREVRPDFR